MDDQLRRLMAERDLLLSAISPVDYAKIQAQLVAVSESPDEPLKGELLPCPFCGGEAEFMGMDFEIGDVERIECTKCGVRTQRGTKASTVAHWNTREHI